MPESIFAAALFSFGRTYESNNNIHLLNSSTEYTCVQYIMLAIIGYF